MNNVKKCFYKNIYNIRYWAIREQAKIFDDSIDYSLFNDEQVYEIWKGLKQGIDVKKYADPNISIEEMKKERMKQIKTNKKKRLEIRIMKEYKNNQMIKIYSEIKPSKWNGFILKKDMVYGEVNNQKFVFYIDYVGEDYQGMGAIVKASVYYLNTEDNEWYCNSGVSLNDIEDVIKNIINDTHFEFDDTIKNFMSEQEDELYISYEIGNAIDEIIEYKTDDIDYRSLVDSNETLNEYFKPVQLTQIIYGLMEKLNVYEYANPKISAKEMKRIREKIEKKKQKMKGF